MWCARLLPLVSIVACGVGCGGASRSATLPRGPLSSPVAAWIPADVLLAVVGTPGDELRAVDAALEAMGWTDVDELLPEGSRLRMVLEAEVNAICRDVSPDQPLPAGTVRTSAGALLITVGDEIVVVRDQIACTIRGGAASRRDHHALRLAAMVDDERLLRRPEARAALGALPAAPLVVWGGGDLVAGISIDRFDPDTGVALAALGEVALALGIDGEARRGWLALVAAKAPDTSRPRTSRREPPIEVAVGPRVAPPMPAGLASLPVPVADENVDVPESEAYRIAVAQLGGVLSEAIEVGREIAAVEARALQAWQQAWGEAELVRRIHQGALTIELTWDPPAWPIEAIRAKASEAYHQVVRADAAALIARYEALLAEARALIDELVRIRARDVAAWDKRQP